MKKQNILAAVSTGLVGVAASVPSYALDTAPVQAALDGGTAAVTLTTAGVVGLVAIVVGVGLVIAWLKRT